MPKFLPAATRTLAVLAVGLLTLAACSVPDADRSPEGEVARDGRPLVATTFTVL